jgi:hypothetical protein
MVTQNGHFFFPDKLLSFPDELWHLVRDFFSAKGAAIRKSKTSLLSDRTLGIGLFGSRHRWTIIAARCVSLSAMTMMLCAVLIESGSRYNNSARRRAGSSNRWNCSPRGIRERGSANPPYEPGGQQEPLNSRRGVPFRISFMPCWPIR